MLPGSFVETRTIRPPGFDSAPPKRGFAQGNLEQAATAACRNPRRGFGPRLRAHYSRGSKFREQCGLLGGLFRASLLGLFDPRLGGHLHARHQLHGLLEVLERAGVLLRLDAQDPSVEVRCGLPGV